MHSNNYSLFCTLVFAINTNGSANGPNKIPIANQKLLLAFLFAAIKYKSAPKNAVIKIRYTMIHAPQLLFHIDLNNRIN
ncbi:hypothetical protein GMMP13_470007 [Candidatus Magnetomoraceae bacterium gMMP-13]